MRLDSHCPTAQPSYLAARPLTPSVYPPVYLRAR